MTLIRKKEVESENKLRYKVSVFLINRYLLVEQKTAYNCLRKKTEHKKTLNKMLGVAKDPLQHTSMYERLEEGRKEFLNNKIL